jgi:hypothetical protein
MLEKNRAVNISAYLQAKFIDFSPFLPASLLGVYAATRAVNPGE